MVLGGRDDAACRRLPGKVGLTGRTFVTEDWEGCRRVIAEDQLLTGQDLTSEGSPTARKRTWLPLLPAPHNAPVDVQWKARP